MSKVAHLHSHTSSKRDSWWHLVQAEDGTLHVEHHNDDDPDAGTTRWPINDFIKQSGPAATKLKALVNRLFED